MPDLSVLMSVRNGAAHLPEAIQSLESQSETSFECLVMDDGSTDSTRALLEAWKKRDSRVRLFTRNYSAGLTAALIELFAKTNSPYVARQDADDISLPERLAHQLEYLERHPEIGLVGCNYDLIDENGELLDELRPPEEPSEIKRLLPQRNVLAHGSWMARRADVLDAGGYRPFFRYAQDYDLLLRLIERSSVASVALNLYQLRLGSGSLSFSKRRQQKWYAETARRAFALRRSGKSDREFLALLKPPADSSKKADQAESERFVLLLKSLHAIKSGRIQAAQELLRRVPWHYRPAQALILRALCRTPEFLRRHFFKSPRERSFLA